MSEVKTNKEYQAFLSEIEAVKEANSRMEEEILQVMDEIDELKRISKREKDARSPWKKWKRSKKNFRRRWPMMKSLGQADGAQRGPFETDRIQTGQALSYSEGEKTGSGRVGVKHETCQGFM